MFAPDLSLENAIKFSRFDRDHLLSTMSPHPFHLEGLEWPTAEHYYNAQLAGSAESAGKIRAAASAIDAYKLGKSWFLRKRRNWKNLRRVLMTRALYTKAMAYPEVRRFLLDSGEERIVETALYDHFWGIGRDLRGENTLGKVWMDIRRKIREDGDS